MEDDLYDDYDWIPTLHKDEIIAHADEAGSIDIHISEPKYYREHPLNTIGYSLESYVPIVADYFDKNLHYDATHYLYEPENMSELLNKPADEPKDEEPSDAPV